MAEHEKKPPRVSHESRLLLLTIVVCVVVLLLLARLRFPEATPVVETAVQPLERLAARASYDALAADIERVQALIAPNVVVLRTAPGAEPTPRGVRDVLDPPPAVPGVRHVAALRIASGMAFAAIAPDARIEAIVGGQPVAGTAAVLAVDPLRRIGRLRVPEAQARAVVPVALPSLRTPTYVVAIEGTRAGVTLRPIFLGRGDRFASARWARPLLPLGGTAVSPGALLFTMAGEFAGCVVVEEGATAIADAQDVLDAVARLASAPASRPATLGISVQQLTAELASALKTPAGVVVSEVDPAGPAAGTLRPADVLTALGAEQITNVDTFLVRVASHAPGEALPMTIARGGATQTVTLTPVAVSRMPVVTAQPVGFEQTQNRQTRAFAARAGRGHAAIGLQPDDVIVGAGGILDPTPADVQRLLDTTDPSTAIPFTIRRNGEQRVLAVRVPARADVPRN